MKNLIIEAVADSPYYPEVNFDATTGVCEMKGESYMEEAYKFYTPLLDWIREYSLEGNDVKKSEDAGNKIQINWYYEVDDPDIKDEIEDFEIETGLKIKLIPME